jgi:heme-degrading monooxygenase HmoA
MATYRFTADPQDLARQAEKGLLPIFMKQPGFRDFSLFADMSEVQREGKGSPDERQFIAITLWDSSGRGHDGRRAAVTGSMRT